jgi:uncharacterized protein YeaO (DUF488 family)
MIQIKRVYEAPASEDDARFLVEQLWPRGMKKEALKIDGWVKDIAPSAGLRRWFNHDPAKWMEFQKRYRAELAGHTAESHQLLKAAKHCNVTLLYSAHDTAHNNAVVLQHYLEAKLRRK